MKKILGAVAALSLIGSAAFADITVSGRGYVETQVFNYTKGTGTSLFSNWDTDDSDVFVSGDIGGKAGAMLNIDFAAAKTGGPLAVGDWNVWIKPLDFLTIKASNEANRVANRYNSIIDKTEAKWGVLTGTYNGGSYDDDRLNGYMVNLDFDMVKIDLAFNQTMVDNKFSFGALSYTENDTEYTADKYSSGAMGFLNDVKIKGTTGSVDGNYFGFGARVVVPVEGLLNVDAFFRMQSYDYTYTDSSVKRDIENRKMSFGAIVDVVAIDNMGLAIGYIGHSEDKDTLMNAVDVRFQYNMDKMGFALHNNATFGEEKFYDKLNLGFMYGMTDAATLFVEVQNWMDASDSDKLADVLTVYPRFAFGIAEGVTLKTGLRADFGVVNADDTMVIALPLSMEVIF